MRRSLIWEFISKNFCRRHKQFSCNVCLYRIRILIWLKLNRFNELAMILLFNKLDNYLGLVCFSNYKRFSFTQQMSEKETKCTFLENLTLRSFMPISFMGVFMATKSPIYFKECINFWRKACNCPNFIFWKTFAFHIFLWIVKRCASIF